MIFVCHPERFGEPPLYGFWTYRWKISEGDGPVLSGLSRTPRRAFRDARRALRRSQDMAAYMAKFRA